MKKIKLTRGKYALVDNDDFEYLNQWKWCFCASGNGYAARHKHISGSGEKRVRKVIYMHREINNTPNGFETDHINRDGLDNRKSNLRLADRRLNVINRGLSKNNISGVKGVHKHRNRWVARICVNYKEIHLGCFVDKKTATMERQKAEKIYFNI